MSLYIYLTLALVQWLKKNWNELSIVVPNILLRWIVFSRRLCKKLYMYMGKYRRVYDTYIR